MKAAILSLIFAGLVIALFGPFKAFGDQSFGPGFGDLLNGSVSLVLLLTAGVVAVVVGRRRRKQREGDPK
jgi:uncharacterized membrane protein